MGYDSELSEDEWAIIRCVRRLARFRHLEGPQVIIDAEGALISRRVMLAAGFSDEKARSTTLGPYDTYALGQRKPSPLESYAHDAVSPIVQSIVDDMLTGAPAVVPPLPSYRKPPRQCRRCGEPIGPDQITCNPVCRP